MDGTIMESLSCEPMIHASAGSSARSSSRSGASCMEEASSVDNALSQPDPRSLIDPNADWHLNNWSQWMERYSVGLGYPHASVVVRSLSSSTVDEMIERKDRHAARTVDAILDGLSAAHQAAIHNIYLSAVWRFRGDPVEVFVEAVGQFWEIAQRRGLS